MRVRHHASGVSYQLSTAAGLSDLKGPLTKFDQIYRPVILNWRLVWLNFLPDRVATSRDIAKH